MAKNTVPKKTVLKDVPLAKMRVSDLSQRSLNESRVDHLLHDFDLDQLGYPIVSERDGFFYIIDGQHRIAGLKEWLGKGWESQSLTCAVYHGLTEAEEAEMFLRHNDVLQVKVFDKFKASVNAGRDAEVTVKRTVEAQGLTIAQGHTPGAIGAVGTLMRVYRESDAETLARALRLIRDSFGDTGFEAVVISGMGSLCKRYNGQLDEETAKRKLSHMHGGVKGLLNRAEEIRLRTGGTRGHSVAAAAVDVINSGKGGKKLPSWWAEA